MTGHKSVRQLEVLDAIRGFIHVKEYSPSIRDLSWMTGIPSQGLISFYLDKLEAAGLIKMDARISRSIRLTSPFAAGDVNVQRYIAMAMDIEHPRPRGGASHKVKKQGIRPLAIKKDATVEERVNLIVEMDQRGESVRGSDQDVVRHNRSMILFRTMKATKVG